MKELTEALKKTKKIIFGSERTLKLLRSDKLSKIFLSSNCPIKVKETIEKNAKTSKVEIVDLEMKNNEVGVFCKKTFSVSVVGLEK
tara:strand:- start:246 stop:503 length:258 start_codon:yes stop_codon:yes gene_type:complete